MQAVRDEHIEAGFDVVSLNVSEVGLNGYITLQCRVKPHWYNASTLRSRSIEIKRGIYRQLVCQGVRCKAVASVEERRLKNLSGRKHCSL
jgi:hypothetical protein